MMVVEAVLGTITSTTNGKKTSPCLMVIEQYLHLVLLYCVTEGHFRKLENSAVQFKCDRRRLFPKMDLSSVEERRIQSPVSCHIKWMDV